MPNNKARFLLIASLLAASSAFAQTAGLSSDTHYASAVELRARAKSAYASGEYDTAADLARKAKAELALVQGNPAALKAEASLPAVYTVRLLEGARDCLYKIAGYSFVYGDPEKWPVLYRANKGTLRHPDNADLIYPGEVLVIPSISGEAREGNWESGKSYPDFSRK
jgi:nucleoid-associated protein YgaU